MVKGWLDHTIIIQFNTAVSQPCALVQSALSSPEEQSTFSNNFFLSFFYVKDRLNISVYAADTYSLPLGIFIFWQLLWQIQPKQTKEVLVQTGWHVVLCMYSRGICALFLNLITDKTIDRQNASRITARAKCWKATLNKLRKCFEKLLAKLKRGSGSSVSSSRLASL